MDKNQNFYQLLGIERDADERAIKKAYFALVRKYPPETHPEEFKRIREAYEVLSNATSRKDYDAINQYDQYGEAVSMRMKEGMNAMDQGDWRTAQVCFRDVLDMQPALHFARDLLGMAHLNNQEPMKALEQFDAVVAAQPDNAVYQLHKGYAHHHQKQYAPAMTSYRKARELDKADTRVLVAMADCLSEQKQYDAALEELDKAINLDGKVDFDDFIFFMRKVQIQLLRNRADLAEQDLDQIFKILPEDPEARKYVATRLSSLAADLFAMKRSVDANRLLARCAKLDPSRASMGFQFPSRSTVPIATLPKNSQEWIIKHGKEFAAGKLQHGVWGGPVFLTICASILLMIALNVTLNSQTLWTGGFIAFETIFLAGSAALLALSIKRIQRVKNSPYGKYTTIHPLHLMQVDVDKATMWPLVNLHDVSLTHHSTNGVYQYTAVRLDFAGTVCNLTIRGQQASVDWANRLLGQRRRCLELMANGLLDAEDGFDLVPPSSLDGSAPKAPADPQAGKKSLKWYGAFAGAGIVLGLVGIPMNRAAFERKYWKSCDNYPTLSSCRYYLERFPSGSHAKEAHSKIDDMYAKALEKYKEKAPNADPKALEAMQHIFDALNKSGATRVKITYENAVDFAELKNVDKKEYADVTPPDAAFTSSYNKSRESSITSALKSAFGSVLDKEILEFDDGSYSYDYDYDYRYGERRKRPPSPVTFNIKYTVTPSGSIYESTSGPKKRMFGILFAWDFTVKIDGDTSEPFELKLPSRPATNIRYSTYGSYDADILPYTKMAESAFEDFGRKLSGSFGVTVPPPSDYSRPSSYGGSGYGGSGSGKYGSKYGSGKLDPEVQKILDDAMKRARERNKY
jgi:tetratricopeptide (TPR) repeat protein